MHIGVAVDTDRGLLVPVIRDADKKNLIQIAVELAQLSEKARTRKITLDEMQGGCFSISNLGGIGGSFFTPIVNAPEVAILGISRGRFKPVYDEETGEFVPRLLLPLSLSYDHRVIDGADGIRFLRWVVGGVRAAVHDGASRVVFQGRSAGRAGQAGRDERVRHAEFLAALPGPPGHPPTSSL